MEEMHLNKFKNLSSGVPEESADSNDCSLDKTTPAWEYLKQVWNVCLLGMEEMELWEKWELCSSFLIIYCFCTDIY